MPNQPEPIILNVQGNAKSEAAAIAGELAKTEEKVEASKAVLKDLQGSLRETKARAKELAAAYAELKDEQLRSAAKGAYEEAREEVDGLTQSIAHVKAQQKAAKDEATGLKERLREVNAEAKRADREGAKALADSLKRAEEEAKKLNTNLDPSKAKKVADELERGARAGKSGSGFSVGGALTTAAGSLAASGVQQLVAATADWIRSIPEGAAAAERHQRALQALGSAYAEVQHATNNTVTAEQAYAVQQRLTESGLALNGRQLASVTARAREYARAVGIDTQQALEQLTEGLNQGTSEGLRRFGIVVQQGATRTETFRSALRQLDQMQRGTGTSAVTVAEAEEQLSRAVTEANQSLQAMIAEKAGLADFFSQTATWIRDLTDGTRSLSGELRNAAAGFGLLDTARAQSINQSNSGQFVQQATAALDEARRAGVDTTGLPPLGNFAINATATQREQFLNIVRRMVRERTGGARTQGVDVATERAGRGLFGDATGINGLRDIGAENGLDDSLRAQVRDLVATAASEAAKRTEAERRRLAAEEEARQRALRQTGAREAGARVAPSDADAVREATAELARARGALVGAGFGGGLGLSGSDSKRDLNAEQLEVLRQRAAETQARRGETELARLQRLTAATTAYMAAQTEQAQREQQQAQAAQQIATQRVLAGATEAEDRRQHETEALAQAAAMVQSQHAQRDAENGLHEAERRRAVDADARLRQIGELRTALRALLVETDARIAAMQAEGRSQAELNSLYQVRVGLQQSLAQASREQTEIQQQQTAGTTAWKESMVGALSSTTDAFAASSIAALESGKSWSDAMQETLRASLFALAKQAIVETLKHTALGFGALAGLNALSAANEFTAAGLWAATGIAAGAVGVAIPKPSTSTPSATASTPAPRAASLGSSDRGGASAQPLQISISVSGALMTSEQVQDGIVRGLDHAHARGVIPRFLRNN